MGFLTWKRCRDRKSRRGASRCHALLVLAIATTACGRATEPPATLAASGEWLEFEGTWNAAGRRRTIPLGADRHGSIIDLSGTMLPRNSKLSVSARVSNWRRKSPGRTSL